MSAVCGWAAWFGASYEDRGQKRQFRVAGESMRVYERCLYALLGGGISRNHRKAPGEEENANPTVCLAWNHAKWIHLCFHCTYRLSSLEWMALCEHRLHVRHKTLSPVKRDSLSTGISFVSLLLVIGLTFAALIPLMPLIPIQSNDKIK